ncbi:nucleoside monophosphate kinase [bacterium]|nr:nucleoside monophosphate kinase [bacterium]
MIAVFLGPPGSGKGTQAARLAKRFGLLHFDMGRSLREEIASGSKLGEKIRSYTDIGELVPISIIKEIIEKVLEDSSNESIILDGFPRSEEQADLLDDVLIRLGLDLKGVYFFSIGDNAIIDRITNRRYCPVCRKVYNLKSAPPLIDGKCDEDGSELVTRPDDNEDVIANRLDVYRRKTAPILARYRRKGKLTELDATLAIADIEKLLMEHIGLQ